MTADTIGRQAERGAKIRWQCDVVSSHYGDVDLKRIARAKGGDYVLVNKRPPCRIPGCPGIVSFSDCSRVYWQKLETLSDRDPEWWAFNDKRRAELIALGWRVEMGKWVAPKKEAPRGSGEGPGKGVHEERR
jgi:hypothetical protein